MKIILVLLGMLLTCGLSGALLIYAFRASENLKKLSLHIGYAYTLVAFYLFYMQLNSAFTATALTVALPTLLAALTLLVSRLRHRPTTGVVAQPPSGAVAGARSELAYIVAASAVAVLLAAWPYLLSGWGSYWHAGNYDIEDALWGRDAYINNQIIDTRPLNMGEYFHDKSWYDFMKTTNTLPRLGKMETYGDAFAGDQTRFQYSSLAFWAVLFNERHGMDMFIVQAILNLILMGVGVFHLSRQAFSMTPAASAMASVISVNSSFYLTTFFAGHEGSLMYGSLIPALLFLALTKADTHRAMAYKLISGGLITGAIAFTYPHPLAIIVLPVMAYWLFSLESFRNRLEVTLQTIGKNPPILWLAIIGSLIAVSIIALGLWNVTEGYRLVQYGQYRAWGYTHDWIIAPLYLGLMPSPGAGFHFAVGVLGKPAYLALTLVSCLLAGILCVLYFKARPPTNSKFFLIFGLFWIVEYFIFRYFIADSYYLYKFLYTHQFVIVIGVVAYVFHTRSRFIKSLCAGIVLANLASDLAWGYDVSRRPYNQHPERLTGLLHLDKTLLRKSFVDLARCDATQVRETLKTHGVTTEKEPGSADYLIAYSGREHGIASSQLTETIAEAGTFSIKRAPAKNYLVIRTRWAEPELFPADPVLKNTIFQWIGQGKEDNLGILIYRPSPFPKMEERYLRICFQRGPSADGAINITVSAGGKDVLRKFVLDGGVHCEWIPAEQVVGVAQTLVIRSGARGKSLLPYDDRILLYRVFGVGWTDRIYDDTVMPFFNATPDIIKNGSMKAEDGSISDVSLHLGQGWEAYESFGGANFRWAGRSTELTLTGGGKDGVANVAVELEPGPSHGKKILELDVLDKDGNLVATSAPITGRNTVVLPLGYYKGQTSVYKLKTKSINLPVPGDSRILNYRVFSIASQ